MATVRPTLDVRVSGRTCIPPQKQMFFGNAVISTDSSNVKVPATPWSMPQVQQFLVTSERSV